ncbi:hypothetical protein [Candidatus Similichlamydia epinepheli]|uniref:hypothetical protein n=1 Tax=Candidatus Similichlamydia epinepheli TaxID=1903953 RepID=UPI00130091ED|nr:hypothetical protein [Candidatus Similichlamydia epinepheli]
MTSSWPLGSEVSSLEEMDVVEVDELGRSNAPLGGTRVDINDISVETNVVDNATPCSQLPHDVCELTNDWKQNKKILVDKKIINITNLSTHDSDGEREINKASSS